jgi:hypothetical protein
MRAVLAVLAVLGATGADAAVNVRPGTTPNWADSSIIRSCTEAGLCRATGSFGDSMEPHLGARFANLVQPIGDEASEFPDEPIRQSPRKGGGGRVRFRPTTAVLRKLVRRPVPDLFEAAREQWDVAPGGTQSISAGVHLPGQIERIKATEFAPIDHVIRVLRGGFEIEQGPTRAYRIRDVDLIDGVLYGSGTQRHLRPRRTRSPVYQAPTEAVSGTMYESWTGNRWFGCWLAEDCLAYPLARAYGNPIATPVDGNWAHRKAYDARLGIAPRHASPIHFDELTLFDDTASNAGRAMRAQEMREKLIQGCGAAPVPGVFLLRGKSGDLRLMANESEVAQRLAAEYGFLILDPSTATVDQIAFACGQARVIAGVEGSHMVHGAVMMPADATLFVIQPPTRATVFLKALTDLRGQRFAFVVAEGGVDGFTCDWTEIRRTLDMALVA